MESTGKTINKLLKSDFCNLRTDQFSNLYKSLKKLIHL